MKKPLLLGCCFFIALSIRAQEFAFAPSSNSSQLSERTGGYKKATAQKVFDALLRARGDYRMQTPVLVLSKKRGNIACFNPDQIQVVLDEAAYDVCAGFGKDSLNALAALLAHELIHYYEKHDWSRHFARENENLETAKRLEYLEEGLKQETQADYLGGFMAFSVGFNTYGIMPKLLKKLYQSYELPDDLPGYPKLEERLKMVDGAMTQLQSLQMVFETANMLAILGDYGAASSYYRFILQTYQSREIYNNAGVNAALAALALYNPADMPYVLPLELDPQSRLFSLKNNDLELESRKSVYLKAALDYFDRALALDEDYATSYLNKSCILALRAEWDDAEYFLKKGRKKAKSPQAEADFDAMEGVLAALQNDEPSAVKHWESAIKQGNVWAKTNLEILQKTATTKPGNPLPAKGVEEIEKFPLADFMESPTRDKEVKVEEKVYCAFRQFSQSRLFVHYISKNDYVLVQETQPDYTGRSLRGIGIGDAQDKVLAAYGKPPRSVALPGASVWVYPEANLYFRFTPGNTVANWAVFRRSGP